MRIEPYCDEEVGPAFVALWIGTYKLVDEPYNPHIRTIMHAKCGILHIKNELISCDVLLMSWISLKTTYQPVK